MNDASAHDGDVKLSNHTVVAEGCFGSVIWNVCDELYALMPRDKRDQLLEGSAARVINPYFMGLTDRLLRQAGSRGVATDSLNTDWSFQTREVSCEFGSVNWQIGQGLWDALPEDQRDALCRLADTLVHDFFVERVYVPLMQYAYRQMHG